MEPSAREEACFEAGIKFGTIYHQFVGTPLTVDSAASLETAMAEAVENQPHCVDAAVEIRRDAVRDAIESASADYVELTGRFADVEITVAYEDWIVETSMAMEDGYPLMRVDRVRPADDAAA